MRRAIASIVFALALALPGLTLAQQQSLPALSNISNMTDVEREVFRAEVRAYLLDNPEVILEVIDLLEARGRADSQQADAELIAANSELLYNDPNAWVAGNPDGDVTLVEFADYRCGFCKKAHPELMELLKRDPNLRLVLKEFPILGPDSTAAARMALAAIDLDPSKFEALNDSLMRFDGQLNEAIAYNIASIEGYDVAALKDRAASPEIEALIEDNYALARTLGLQGTPSFILGNQIIRGYIPLDKMIAAVAEARAATN
jgi:protein-disulfide isomerase